MPLKKPSIKMEVFTKKIQERTGLTSSNYEVILFDTYNSLLSELARDEQHLQFLLMNKPINKWFLREVNKINKEFIKTTIPYISLDKKEVEKCYRSFIKRIAKNYPSALVNRVKKSKQPIKLTTWN